MKNTFIGNPFSAKGRLNRGQFLAVFLIVTVLKAALYMAIAVSLHLGIEGGAVIIWGIAWALLFGATVWFACAQVVKRLRDTGRRGEWVVAVFVPGLSLALSIYLLLAPSIAVSDGPVVPRT